MKLHQSAIVAGLLAGGSLLLPSAAYAGHDHFVVTPNGSCHQVALGQTAIDDPEHGGYHRFHENVHLGATESDTAPDTFGDGSSRVSVYRDSCP
jgi:hypothetical protein